MNGILSLCIALLVGPTLIAVASRVIHGGSVGFNPWVAFIGVWAVSCGLYLANPLHLYQISSSTWAIICGALLAMTLGYGVCYFMLAGGTRQQEARSTR